MTKKKQRNTRQSEEFQHLIEIIVEPVQETMSDNSRICTRNDVRR
jgi:hypothetical protein